MVRVAHFYFARVRAIVERLVFANPLRYDQMN